MLATAGKKTEQNGPKFFEDALVPAWGKTGFKKSIFFNQIFSSNFFLILRHSFVLWLVRMEERNVYG